VDEDEEEREEDLETSEESSDLYLITECWIEPQVGKILSNPESISFHGLEFDQVLIKVSSMISLRFSFEGKCECVSLCAFFF